MRRRLRRKTAHAAILSVAFSGSTAQDSLVEQPPCSDLRKENSSAALQHGNWVADRALVDAIVDRRARHQRQARQFSSDRQLAQIASLASKRS